MKTLTTRQGSTPATGKVRGAGLSGLVSQLDELGYAFVTPNTGTIRWNRTQRRDEPRTLQDIFGWSLPFAEGDLPSHVFQTALAADLLAPSGGLWASRVRVSSVEGVLFAHSAFPTTAKDAVFLGPDTYRFARMIAHCAPALSPARILDLGTGAGVGAVLAARRYPHGLVVASDVNPQALAMTVSNAQAAQVRVKTTLCADVPAARSGYDLILANPPFIGGNSGRTYSDGGGLAGIEIPLRWAVSGARRLAPGGRLLLYTGSPVSNGRHRLRDMLDSRLASSACHVDFWEIDPDIFSSVLGSPGYEGVERLAAVGVVISRPG